MSNIVKYHNDINEIPLRNLTEKELNIFFTLIYKAKNEGLSLIKLDFLELKELSNGDTKTNRFISALDNMDKKLLNLNQSVEIEKGVYERFNLFNTFRIDTNNKTLEIEIHRNFTYMLNDLPNYTKFELSQLVNLKSSYSKNMFRILKQFESSKMKIMFLEDFKRILCIPTSYRMTDINKRILTPVMKELTPVFPNLKLEKVKKGRSISKLIFTWGVRKLENKSVREPKVLEISEDLIKAIDKTKKNRFIKPLLTNSNIIKLVEKFSDDDLTKGLLFANKEIKKEITSLNYLEKTINTATEEVEIKIVAKKSEPKGVQGVELTEDNEEPLKSKIRTSKSEELKEFIEDIKKIGKEKIKGSELYILNAELTGACTFEKVNELIEKYKLND